MSKEYLEALGLIKRTCEIYVDSLKQRDLIGYDIIEKQINEALNTIQNCLDSIDNSNPSEALECLKQIEDVIETKIGLGVVNTYLINTIKQSLIKSQEQEKVLKILKEKQVDLNLFITIIPFNKSIEELTRAYNQCFIERCRLTIEETTLLKRYFK